MKMLRFLVPCMALVFIAHCGGNSGQVVELPGTMTLSSGVPPSLSFQKFGVVADEEVIELETKMTAKTTEEPDFIELEIQDFEAEGEFPTEGPVKVTLNPEGDSNGIVFKLDENDQPLGKHQIQLDLVIEINGQSLAFNDVQLGGFTEELELEVEVAPIEYRNGSEDVHLMKISGMKKMANVVFKRSNPEATEFSEEESP